MIDPAQIKELMADMGTAMDRLNEKIRSLEAIFDVIRVGVKVEIRCPSGVLAYCKHNKRWGFTWTPTNGETVPLLSAPAMDRLEAVDRIPDLFPAMVEEGERQLKAINEANMRMAEYIEAVKAAK